jgi:hypothetical protein
MNNGHPTYRGAAASTPDKKRLRQFHLNALKRIKLTLVHQKEKQSIGLKS